MHDIMSSIFRS